MSTTTSSLPLLAGGLRGVVFALALSAACAFAFAADIEGTVKDFSDGTPVAGAEVTLRDLKLSTITDGRGSFRFESVPAGRYVLMISKSGFHTFIAEQLVEENRTSVLTVELQPAEQGEGTAEHAAQQPRYRLDEVTVLTTRAQSTDPVTFTNLTREEVKERSYGQDIALLFTELPGVSAYSDGANGIGYSYLRMRGFSQNRVAAQINGTPLNDAGSHEVFWIDLPDFASDLADVQVQRGVGSSLYGPAAFGGTVNLVTKTPGLEEGARLRAEGTHGAWNTRRAMVSFESGRIQNRYGIAARLTRMKTAGYREGSWADLWSYYLAAARFTPNHTSRAVFYGGPERTHLAYEGITDAQLDTSRRYNPLTYGGEIDNFFQPHYELHDEWTLSRRATLNNTLYLFRGDGYYDQWRPVQQPARYYYDGDWGTFDYVNVLRRRNVGETDWGWIPRLSIEHKLGTTDIGGELRIHRAQHWGEVRYADFVFSIEGLDDMPVGIGDPQYKYYDYRIRKESGAGYVHNIFNITPRLRAMADLQLRFVRFRMDRDRLWGVSWEKSWGFLAPRVGLSYELLSPREASGRPSALVYLNVSDADREPAYSDVYDPQDYYSLPINAPNRFEGSAGNWRYTGPALNPEQLLDFEAGTNWQWKELRLGANVYWMQLKDEIIPYGGQLDDNGVPVSGNAEKTLHQGIEFIASYEPMQTLTLSGNLALTDHHFVRYQEWDWSLNDWSGGFAERDGNRLGQDPIYVGNLRTEYSRRGAWAALSLRAVGKQYIDNSQNDETAVPEYAILSLDLGYRWSGLGLRAAEVRLRVNNLLDREYVAFGYTDWDDYSPRYIVAAPRAVYTTLAVEL